MNRIKNVSTQGLERLARHEGLVQGIYDCPARHATYGIGTLVHHGPSEILKVVSQASATKAQTPEAELAAKLASHLKVYRPSKNSVAVPYLDAAIGKDENYPVLVKEMLAGKAPRAKLVEGEDAVLRPGWDEYIRRFRTGIQKYEKAVCEAFASASLTQDQFDGLFSIAYNIGEGSLRQSGDLIAAMKAFSVASLDPKATGGQRDQAATVLLECILRARPTSRAGVDVEIDGGSFSVMQPGVFNSGLFNRRVAEASLIVGRTYSTKSAEITIARKTIKAEKDHHTTTMAKQEARAVVDMLHKISFVNRGFR
ncbi:glycoside hydrolase family protein [Roseateles saccharophilus]|uniref:Lysozyme n=1 Tax=Roseateles saccharophilus TaxID=304 RepID=A0A4R3VKC7_ROSSA|nr:hypothetical protein [Roseateles saccharophilus]MDG0831149.1 hypothetical protein [Roseateles saccharophilus]TCV04269.1 hypothetical protein EV671_100124 [Roseateles saccharophilus]